MEIGPHQGSSTNDGSAEIRLGEVRSSKVCRTEDRPDEARLAQVGRAKVRVEQVCRLKARSVEVCSTEIWPRIRIARPPFVPSFGPLPQ